VLQRPRSLGLPSNRGWKHWKASILFISTITSIISIIDVIVEMNNILAFHPRFPWMVTLRERPARV
jgi:hypothetical protein